MLTEKQIKEIREHLEKAQNPVFFFDNDIDGLSSFLLLCRYIERGKGVVIRSYPDLNAGYFRKINELNPDYVFILDKPQVSKEFIDEVKSKNLPIVWIDHHGVDVDKGILEGIFYYNPNFNEDKTSEPVSYLCYQVSNKKEDLWISLMGCIGDAFMPDFFNESLKRYPEVLETDKEIKEPFDVYYNTKIGEIARVLNFALKDRISNVVQMMKFLLKVKQPNEILEENYKTRQILRRYKQLKLKYDKFLSKAKSFINENKIVFFQYGGEFSLSADIANELFYSYPDKIIVVAYLKGTKANISLRGKIDIRKATVEAIKGLENATGGGHKHATGATIFIEDLDKFKENLRKAVEE